MATADYLNQLIADRNTLANNLHEIDGTSSTSETFTQLAPKVSNIKTAIQGLNVVNTTQESTSLTITDGKEAQINKIDVLGRTEQKTTTGKNFFNANLLTSPIIVEDLGKTIKLPIDTEGIGYLNTLKTLKQVCPNLNVGDTAYLYFNRNLGYQEYNSRIYCDSAQVAWQVGTNKIITQEMLDSYVIMYANRYIAGETQQCILTDFRIVKNENEPYEPYTGGIPSPNPDYPSPIENVRGSTVDNTINFSVEGKNKLSAQPLINNTQQILVDFGEDRTFDRVTFSMILTNFKIVEEGAAILDYRKDDGTHQYRTGAYDFGLATNTIYNLLKAKIENNITFRYLVFYGYSAGYSSMSGSVTNVQLEIGDYTPYEPYHTPQTVAFPLGDKVLMQGSKLTEYGFYDERGQKVLDGSETGWYKTSYNRYACLSLFIGITNIVNIKSDYFKYGNTETTNNIFAIAPNGTIYIRYDDMETLPDFKTWLSTHPTTVEYELATPTITPYTAEQQTAYNQLKALLLHTGTNYITTDGNLPPNMKIEYKQDALLVVRSED